ncbi:MAG TPA: DUF2177 family protein [Erysipelotrichaceae bacterium]|nr:DUF2177 family protein [Erysipelotrichaceae bacterium]
MEVLRNYLITFIVYFIVEIAWLTLIARNFYAKYLGHLMADNPNLLVSLIYFVVAVAGLVFFAVNPALDKNSLAYALMAGAIFGLMTYATYSMTNFATLKDWPALVTLVDVGWGIVLNGISAGIGFYIIKMFIK